MFVLALMCASLAQLPPLTPKTADEFLAQLHQEEPDYFKRVHAVAEALIGTPYAEDPLGEGPAGPHDRDPLIDLTRVSSLSYVEQCLALAAAPSLEEATKVLTNIRYIGGEVDFARRNHLIVGDWIINNAFVTNITKEVARQRRPVKRFIDRAEYFRHHRAHALFKDQPVEGVTVEYLWLPDLPKELHKIPGNTLIVFIGRDYYHFGSRCGLFFRDGEDGPGKLYYASSEERRAVAVDLEKLAVPNGPDVGLLVFSIHPERMPFLNQSSRTEGPQPPEQPH